MKASWVLTVKWWGYLFKSCSVTDVRGREKLGLAHSRMESPHATLYEKKIKELLLVERKIQLELRVSNQNMKDQKYKSAATKRHRREE